MKKSMMALLLLASPLFAAPNALRQDETQRLTPAHCRFAYLNCTYSCGDDLVCWEGCNTEYNACMGNPTSPESFAAPADGDADLNRD